MVIVLGVAVVVALVGILLLFIFALATRVTFGFRWKALLGFERQCKRSNSLLYVSHGPFLPTAVFWFGSEDWQEDKVAEGVASGRLPRQEFDNAVTKRMNHDAVYGHVRVWPSAASKRLYGQPEDVVPIEE